MAVCRLLLQNISISQSGFSPTSCRFALPAATSCRLNELHDTNDSNFGGIFAATCFESLIQARETQNGSYVSITHKRPVQFEELELVLLSRQTGWSGSAMAETSTPF